ncbi:MBL fold metallo-hydrolase [Janthinobacterium sp.]|uniref:MBL fold metallo-hydrolase n=1 Tax=Janthinobacterium sp. TaxID=1871054 RepID=UPI00293D60A7|nr:MBL fold metallo-hydrolase [Janthinobacterium sp.]
MRSLRLYAVARATLLAGAVASALYAAPAMAAAPMAKTPAPGFFRLMLGDFELTVISDGTLALPVGAIVNNVPPARVEQALAKSFLSSPLETSFNSFLINTGSKLILIDTGAGLLYGPSLGKLRENLRASGYRPEQVDEVYLTHMHPDHVGGLLAGELAAFPNAVVRANWHEWDCCWSRPPIGSPQLDVKMVTLVPYFKSGKYLPFEGDVELTPGIRSYSSKGHSSGHSSFVVESKGQKLFVMGDLIHIAALQFEDPTVTVNLDGDNAAAVVQRKKVFANAARDGLLLGGVHLPFPGLGHVRASGAGYLWLPVNYTQMH